MRSRSILVILFVIGASQVALAQTNADQGTSTHGPVTPASRPRVSQEELLNGRPVAASVDELPSILESGREVVVWDASGRKTRGRVSSLSGDQVVIYRQAATPFLRMFAGPEDRVFATGSLTRLDIVDSTWNGAVIGAAMAPALVFGIHQWEDASVSDSNSLKGLATVVFGGISAVVAIAVGQRIDLSMNRPIYQRQRAIPAVTFAPWLEPTRKGVIARVRF